MYVKIILKMQNKTFHRDNYVIDDIKFYNKLRDIKNTYHISVIKTYFKNNKFVYVNENTTKIVYTDFESIKNVYNENVLPNYNISRELINLIKKYNVFKKCSNHIRKEKLKNL